MLRRKIVDIVGTSCWRRVGMNVGKVGKILWISRIRSWIKRKIPGSRRKIA